MTEAEWLACEEPGPMLRFLYESTRDRKTRLFAIACCRRIEELILRFKGAWRAVILAERIADGEAATEEAEHLRWVLLDRTFSWIDGFREEKLNNTMFDAGIAAAECLAGAVEPLSAYGITMPVGNLAGVSMCAAFAVAHWARRNDAEPVQPNRLAAEQAAQVELFRDIFGNPFHPVTFSPSWRTDTALSLAWQMYESRDFSAMPILADALQDAGCDSDDVLNHCRGPGPHVRGCWVVDLVLGKE